MTTRSSKSSSAWGERVTGFRLRTWVGGDKDGHPGVGPEETDKSLNLSRARLLDLVAGRLLTEVTEDVRLRPDRRLLDAWDRLRDQQEGRTGLLGPIPRFLIAAGAPPSRDPE